MKELVDGGADVNVADEEGRTPLHFACGAAPRARAARAGARTGADGT